MGPLLLVAVSTVAALQLQLLRLFKMVIGRILATTNRNPDDVVLLL